MKFIRVFPVLILGSLIASGCRQRPVVDAAPVLKHYSDEFPKGTPIDAAEKSLRSKNIAFDVEGNAVIISLREDPPPWHCSGMRVLVVIEMSADRKVKKHYVQRRGRDCL
jgi:hypothetical protein